MKQFIYIYPFDNYRHIGTGSGFRLPMFGAGKHKWDITEEIISQCIDSHDISKSSSTPPLYYAGIDTQSLNTNDLQKQNQGKRNEGKRK